MMCLISQNFVILLALPFFNFYLFCILPYNTLLYKYLILIFHIYYLIPLPFDPSHEGLALTFLIDKDIFQLTHFELIHLKTIFCEKS